MNADTHSASRNFPNVPNSADDFHNAEPNLDEKRRAAIEALLLGLNFCETARQINVDRRTLFNWRRQPQFREELSRRRRELWGDAGARLREMIHPALDVLDEHLTDNYDRSRFRAATAILRLAKLAPAAAEGD